MSKRSMGLQGNGRNYINSLRHKSSKENIDSFRYNNYGHKLRTKQLHSSFTYFSNEQLWRGQLSEGVVEINALNEIVSVFCFSNDVFLWR